MSKTPKWRERWDELTKDPATGQPFKHLEIKGWYDWQEKNYTTDYIRDYFGKDEDPDYYMRPTQQRWMMDWLRRQRGRLRHTLPNDPAALLRRMNLLPMNALQAGNDLLMTLECRFLKPTNQQVRDQKWVNKSKVKETNERTNVREVEQEESTPEVPSVQAPVTPSPKPKHVRLFGQHASALCAPWPLPRVGHSLPLCAFQAQLGRWRNPA
jgi:hypothetical protein